MLLGLEILVAADLIRTVAVAPTLDNVLVLGMIVLIRTFLSFSLEIEIHGVLPWRRAPRAARNLRGTRPRTRPSKAEAASDAGQGRPPWSVLTRTLSPLLGTGIAQTPAGAAYARLPLCPPSGRSPPGAANPASAFQFAGQLYLEYARRSLSPGELDA
ncbi:MAG TPA: DUF1622 domain-containing protein [Streptosporangiaceae bacterium]